MDLIKQFPARQADKLLAVNFAKDDAAFRVLEVGES